MGYSRLPVNPRCHSRFKAIPDHPQLRFRRFDLLFAANTANSAGKKRLHPHCFCRRFPQPFSEQT